ncbi:MAG: 1-acyl-sn-glycerol-3-phosphate acyltransferase [Parahaliea sp.]
MSDPFADIRPYRDDEVPAVLAQLLHNPELLDALASLSMGRLARWVPWLCRPLVRFYLARQLRGVQDIYGMQMVVKAYMDRMIADRTGGFTVSGLEQLDAGRPYLFMSNHRDIAMDPAFTNYALNQGGRDTVRIAIGDNLLTKPWVSDLMRLNKSFIVKRSVSGPRELLAASKKLSEYIRHSLLQENSPIWIAQREGRAKDGIDRTEPAVLKMLSMSRDKQASTLSRHIRELGIVPVSIAYEVDPCDALKARELYQRATTGSYIKSEQEDVSSIGRGISGQKGRVHVSFGTALAGEYETADDIARAVDEQIISLYCLHPTNLYAYEMLNGHKPELPTNVCQEAGEWSRKAFVARIEAMPEEHRAYALGIYANAVVGKLALADQHSSC